jgi:glycosyltransferase involved in cell wall biosynthesis
MTDVSIVTTVYNESDNFDKAPPSILQQTYQDFEWLILDDNSTDNTATKLHELAKSDSRITIIETQSRMGRAKCLNKVIEHADGKYIAQQDFDDVSHSERIEKQVKFLENNPEVGVVGGYYERIDKRRSEQYIREVPTSHDEIQRALAKYIPFAHTIVMFRKTAWEDAGGYPPTEDIEDLELWINIAANGWKLRNIPQNLGKHFVYEESSWNSRFEYAQRQRTLAKVQRKAVQRLDLPAWMHLYPFGRYIYPYIPNQIKRPIRQTIGKINEEEI